MDYEMDKRKKHTLESLKKEALKYKTRVDFKKNSGKAFFAAENRGILKEVCSHMTSSYIAWTNESIKLEALKFNTRWEFQQKSRKTYKAAFKRNILDEVCAHMKPQHEKWTLEKIQKEAIKYSTRADFQKNNKAYSIANNRAILNQVCSHMIESSNSSLAEKYLFDAIKQKFPKTQKLRDRKVKIEGKPHIQGFDVDIYIPELRKGIEFDGIYFHSIPGLKRGRTKWPQEDLENYHKIKDEWFKNKGIELLHILENDWLENKEECIKKCFEFLRS